MHVYVELVEKDEEHDSDSDFDSDSESENEIVDEEHVVDKVEVLDFDSLESGLEDVLDNAKSLRHIKLKKNHSSFKFFIGREFINRDLAKDLIRDHAVESRRNLHFLINNKRRIRVVYNGVVPSKNVIINKVQGPVVDISGKGKLVNEDAGEDKSGCPCFLSKHIIDLVILNPQMPIKAIQEQTQKKFHDVVSKDKAFRAKAKSQVHLKGDVKENIYMLGCFEKGFREGGRELLGLDCAFMRGQYPGQMLTAVGVDANNGIYHVAYGIVESENQYSWTWFLKYLGDDFDLYNNSNFTFITDRQKDVSPVLAKLFPSTEHRYCVRHINENINQTWKGSEYKEMLWRCATSTTEVLFQKNRQQLKDFNKKAYEWLHKIPPEHWSRAYFSGMLSTHYYFSFYCFLMGKL
nr:hypothetical protein [Tanacetum cinerariifolium]